MPEPATTDAGHHVKGWNLLEFLIIIFINHNIPA
jgi:hypothetical protein